jgi:hypothetical protein
MSKQIKYRTFPTAFKVKVVKRMEAGEQVAPLAREVGVLRKLLYEWHSAWKSHGAAGLNRKRGPKPGRRVVRPREESAASGKLADLARAQARIAELERMIGRQQVDLDFFRRALRVLDMKTAQGKDAPASTRSSKP